MNLIDFVVTEIVEASYGPIYKLYNLSLVEAQEKFDKGYPYLFDEGCALYYRYRDYGGSSLAKEVFNLTKGEVPYSVGYKGMH